MSWKTTYPEDPLKKIKILLIGETGGGKSTLCSSIPGKSYLFNFDKGEITYNENAFEHDELTDENITILTRWPKIVRIAAQLGKNLPIDCDGEQVQFDNVIVDSLTTLSTTANQVALMENPARDHGNPIGKVHGLAARYKVEAVINSLLGFDGRLIICCHPAYMQVEMTGEMVTVPQAPGALSTILPRLFDEIYICREIPIEGGKTKHVIQTNSVGLMKARSRLAKKYQIPPQLPNEWSALEEAAKKRR